MNLNDMTSIKLCLYKWDYTTKSYKYDPEDQTVPYCHLD